MNKNKYGLRLIILEVRINPKKIKVSSCFSFIRNYIGEKRKWAFTLLVTELQMAEHTGLSSLVFHYSKRVENVISNLQTPLGLPNGSPALASSPLASTLLRGLGFWPFRLGLRAFWAAQGDCISIRNSYMAEP